MTNEAVYELHRDLLALRRTRTAFRNQRAGGVDGAVLSASAFVLRYFTETIDDVRVLIVNLGPDLKGRSIAEPLIAPPADRDWVVEWSSEDPRYGGGGMPDVSTPGRWRLPGESAVVLAPSTRRAGSCAERQAPHRMREASIPVRRLAWPPPDAEEDDALATREWLVTNGLGGYASGTISGVITRRYHGYLIAALPAPLGRMVMLSHIAVQVRYPDGRRIEVGGREQLQPVTTPRTPAT